MALDGLLNSGLATARPPRLVATDVATWLRLEQCERYLRFQLEYRNEAAGAGAGFLDELDVAPQPLPALLTGSGSEFEALVLAAVGERYPLVSFAAERKGAPDNRRLIERIHELPTDETIAVTQPRLRVELGGWDLRGDLDLLVIRRNSDNQLKCTVLDMKSSADSRVEHKIQVAIYLVMLREIVERAGFRIDSLDGGIVYRGAVDPETLAPDARRKHAASKAAAEAFGIPSVLLDLSANDPLYLDAVDDLILSQQSAVRKIARSPLHRTQLQFSGKCDGCFFNEACLKISNDLDDLSRVPFMSLDARQALIRGGIETSAGLAALKVPGSVTIGGVARTALVPASGSEMVCHDLGESRAIAGRLDELVARSRMLNKLSGTGRSDGVNLPGAGYGSLPYSDERHDPNLVRVYLDLQRDYLHDRIYLAGALIQANESGIPVPERRRSVVSMAPTPPESADIERSLLLDFVTRVLVALIEVAAPDESGEANAPIHLIFFERGSMTALLQALGRHMDEVLGATALYDFVAQQPAFDSPMATSLVEEIRTLKNYPLIAPSLQAVARYIGFDWDAERPLTERFRSGHFDDVRPLDEQSGSWFTGRARFNSAIPLEYAYRSWERLDGDHERSASWHSVTQDDIDALAHARLHAMEAIANQFRGNDRSYKAKFALPDLALFEERGASVATGIEEFILTERHVELAAWRNARLAPPEQRMVNGDSLLIRYLESDQAPGVAEANRDHIVRQQRWEAIRDAWVAEHAEDEPLVLSREERDATRWNHNDVRYVFEIVHPGGQERIEHVLGLSEIKIGARILIGDRWSVDGRLPVEEQVEFQTTARQMLYGQRAEVISIEMRRTEGGSLRGMITLEMKPSYGNDPGFLFFGRNQIFADGSLYTVEPDPNNIMLSRGRKLARELQDGLVNAVSERIGGEILPVAWPSTAATGQARFLQGIDEFITLGELHSFEPTKRRFIGALGDARTVLVQGPPGTGKSYTTAFAIWARIQGSLAGGIPCRVVISCKTHAATDVLLRNVAEVQQRLRQLRLHYEARFDRYFDPRILDVPLYRFRGKAPISGVRSLHERGHSAMNGDKAMALLLAREQTVVALTPGGSWSLHGETKDRFQSRFSNLLVLDEASQMSLPEAMMAAISLELDGQLIVVGDHRQMPPIVHHDWMNEARRSFKQFAAYESLYLALDRIVEAEHKIKFEESFRLHRDMAEFLRREIYHQDGIAFFSRRTSTLDLPPGPDRFANAVLGPEPLAIVLHDEAASQTSNQFEQTLIDRITAQLGDFDPLDGMGVVVPHRAQRARLQEAIPVLSIRDEMGVVVRTAVDTVERFQGDERRVIVVGLTESDPHFIRQTGEFLLDPRRLTVALSRAKEKMIVIASRSVFEVIATDEETFSNAGLWKSLLRRTCTELRWSGDIDGSTVVVRTNPFGAGN
jgi:hypothetical protein